MFIDGLKNRIKEVDRELTRVSAKLEEKKKEVEAETEEAIKKEFHVK